MAHELEIVNGQAMMAYRESEGRPWHRLGTPVGDDLTPAEMMKAAGLDWEVESTPTFVDVNGNQIPTGTNALIRKSDQSVLAPICLLYTSPSPRDLSTPRMPSSA